MGGTWREIADRVLVGRYRFYDQDIGAVLGATGVLLVDTRSSPRQAREIVDDLRAHTRLPVRWFVNTHWHYDHTFGNAELRPAEGWGHRACAAGILAHGEQARAELSVEHPELADELEGVVFDPPERTFETETTIDLGAGRFVELRHLGRGHTDSDVVLSVPDTGVLFAGDLRALAELARRAQDEQLAIDDLLPLAPWGGGPLVREGLERALAQLRGEVVPMPR